MLIIHKVTKDPKQFRSRNLNTRKERLRQTHHVVGTAESYQANERKEVKPET